MFSFTSDGFPMFWWIWWFIVAFVVYGLLAFWFWRAGRHYELSRAEEVPTPQVDGQLGDKSTPD